MENTDIAKQENYGIWKNDIPNVVGHIAPYLSSFTEDMYSGKDCKCGILLLYLRRFTLGEENNILCEDVTTRAQDVRYGSTMDSYRSVLKDPQQQQYVKKADFVIAVLNNISIAAARHLEEMREASPEWAARMDENVYDKDVSKFFLVANNANQLGLDIYFLAMHTVITKFLEYIRPGETRMLRLYTDGIIYTYDGIEQKQIGNIADLEDGKQKVAQSNQLVRDAIIATLAQPNMHYSYRENGGLVHPTYEEVLTGRDHQRHEASDKLQVILEDELQLPLAG